MKRIPAITILALAIVLIWTVLFVSAGGPVLGKAGVYDPVVGEGTAQIIAANTHPTAQAQLTVRYYNLLGEEMATSTRQLEAHGAAVFAPSANDLPDWMGFMTLEADQDLATVTEITWEEGGASDGITAGAYRGYGTGATVAYLPFAVYAPNAQFTRITVLNLDAASADIRLEYFNRDGNQDFTVTDTVPAGGSRTYDLHIPGPKVPDFSSTQYWSTHNNTWGGSLKVTSTNGRQIAAIATNHWQQWAVAYNGLSQGAQKHFIPSVERRVPGGVWKGFSVVTAQCLAASGQCQVRMEFYDVTDGSLDMVRTCTINAGAARAVNTKSGGDCNQGGSGSLSDNWAGSAIVRSTNNTDLAVIAYTIRPATQMAAATSAATSSQAGTRNFLPAVYQSRESCPPGYDWTRYSLIRIQNPNTVDANDVDITYYNRDGSRAFQELNLSIPAEKSLNRNTRVHCQDLPLGPDWEGSVTITSDQPLVAVAETIWGDTKMSAYNGTSLP